MRQPLSAFSARYAVVLTLLCSFDTSAQFDTGEKLFHGYSNTSAPIAADIDGDGDQDIVCSSGYTSELFWYENPGNEVFSDQRVHFIDAAGTDLRSIAVADLDNDGDADIVAGDLNNSRLVWFENTGNAVFGAYQVIATGGYGIQHIEVMDLNGDGLKDILQGFGFGQGSWWASISVHLQNAGTTFTASLLTGLSGNAMERFSTTDIDTDGDTDIVIPFSGLVMIYKNNGAGAFTSSYQVTASPYINDLSAKDLNGDGSPDLLTSSGDMALHWFPNDGTGLFQTPILIDSVPFNEAAVIEDIDQDGDNDVATFYQPQGSAQSIIQWFENDGSGNFQPGESIDPVLEGWHIYEDFTTTDIDGDGDKDILAYTTDSYSFLCGWSEYLPDGTFAPFRQIIGQQKQSVAVAAGDADLDGQEDLFVLSHNDGKIGLYRNQGDRTFETQRLIHLVSSYWANSIYHKDSRLITADIDADADADLLIAYSYHSASGSNTCHIEWLENNGNFDFTAHDLTVPTSDSSNIAGFADIQATDIDNDGDKDILYTYYNDSLLAFFENTGSGTFGSRQLIATGQAGISTLVSEDFNGDGQPDIVTGSHLTGELRFLQNTGTLTFATPQTISTSVPGIRSLSAGDIDGDGVRDLVTATEGDNRIAWFHANGDGTFGNRQTACNYFAAPDAVKAADIDLDGDNDIVFAAASQNSVLWCENTGNGSFAPELVIAADLAGVTDVCLFSLDNDAAPDLAAPMSDWQGSVVYFRNLSAGLLQASGRLFVDVDQNGTFDGADYGISETAVLSVPASDFSFTFYDGRYIVNFIDQPGNYELQPAQIPHWGLTTDSASYHIAITDSLQAIVDSLDFGFYPVDQTDELHAQLVGGFPRCNTQVPYHIDIKNIGTTMPSGVIRLTLDENIIYIESVIPPDSVNGQNIYWHYDSLLYFAREQWTVLVQMPDFTATGDTLTSHLAASVTDTAGNAVTFFSDELTQELVCAYDPNDKTVEPAGFGAPGYIHVSTDWLEYTVRFQNTGNDTAMQVVITDQLDTDLDWQSLQPLAQSHPVAIAVDQDGLATFTFEDIYLPDSTTNELASQGFIRYRIHLDAGLDTGTVITNTASIYFDQNPAIVTNTTLNTLYSCTAFGVNEPLDPFFCEGELIEAGVYNLPPTSTIAWTITGVVQQTGPFFSWMADTSGNFTLQLTANNGICNINWPITLSINETTDVHINGPESDTICLQDGTINLPEATPAGGDFFGNGVWGVTFNPAVSGTGDQLVTYHYTNANSCTTVDSIVITVEDCLGIPELNENSVLFFPNPVGSGSELTLQWTQEPNGAYDLTIKNMIGEPVYSNKALNGSTQTISLPKLSAGVYWVLVTDDSGSIIRKQLVID